MAQLRIEVSFGLPVLLISILTIYPSAARLSIRLLKVIADSFEGERIGQRFFDPENNEIAVVDGKCGKRLPG